MVGLSRLCRPLLEHVSLFFCPLVGGDMATVTVTVSLQACSSFIGCWMEHVYGRSEFGDIQRMEFRSDVHASR
ncbi:Uncharacterized protein TCM_029990 [Theobroma cacao]|uniref:Uncharacterized protein n=1 Tax=Theobroma cacao TaxID=3641 RepID=A0A061GMS1_THECC|nr:Uncharacterized protein TCM_029990 [Theobroma cacao]